MTKLTTTRDAPFDHEGNLQHYPQGYYAMSVFRPEQWRTVEPFVATMRLDAGVTSGRSAKYVHLIDGDGRRWPMFVADLLELCHRATIHEGHVAVDEADRWYVRKRGQNFGVALVPR